MGLQIGETYYVQIRSLGGVKKPMIYTGSNAAGGESFVPDRELDKAPLRISKVTLCPEDIGTLVSSCGETIIS